MWFVFRQNGTWFAVAKQKSKSNTDKTNECKKEWMIMGDDKSYVWIKPFFVSSRHQGALSFMLKPRFAMLMNKMNVPHILAGKILRRRLHYISFIMWIYDYRFDYGGLHNMFGASTKNHFKICISIGCFGIKRARALAAKTTLLNGTTTQCDAHCENDNRKSTNC